MFAQFSLQQATEAIAPWETMSPCILGTPQIPMCSVCSPGVGRHPAIEQEGLVVPEEVFLEHLGHHEAVLHLAGPGVLVIRGETGQLLQRVRIRSLQIQNQQPLKCLTF